MGPARTAKKHAPETPERPAGCVLEDFFERAGTRKDGVGPLAERRARVECLVSDPFYELTRPGRIPKLGLRLGSSVSRPLRNRMAKTFLIPSKGSR